MKRAFTTANPNEREPEPVAIVTMTFQRQTPITIGNGGDSIGRIVDSMLASAAGMDERVTHIELDLEPKH